MASFEILWKGPAERELRNIDPNDIARVVSAVEKLSGHPFPNECRKLRGSERSYRIRVGDYRVVYQVDVKTNQIVIYHVRHRKDVYRK